MNTKEWARLFHEYLSGDDTFYKANFGNGEILGLMRTIYAGNRRGIFKTSRSKKGIDVG